MIRRSGEDIVCTFTNTQRGMVELTKLTNGNDDPNQPWYFTLSGAGVPFLIPPLKPEDTAFNTLRMAVVGGILQKLFDFRTGSRDAAAAPPVASVLITACSVARANIWEVSKVNIWFVGVLLAVLMLCTYVPAVPMFLVEYFYR